MRPFVFKLGGSLLDLPDLADRLQTAVDTALRRLAQPAFPVVITGGGQAADCVRSWQQQFALSDSVSHDLAIHAMSFSARLVSSLHSRFVFAHSFPDSGTSQCPTSVDLLIHIMNPESVIRREEQSLPPARQLEKSWNVTSDSIAAWLAQRRRAAGLCLLKSVSLDVEHAAISATHGNVQERSLVLQNLTQRGLVDPCFAEFAAALPTIYWCNLRVEPGLVIPV